MIRPITSNPMLLASSGAPSKQAFDFGLELRLGHVPSDEKQAQLAQYFLERPRLEQTWEQLEAPPSPR